MTLVFLDFRNGKTSRPRDPPFTHPTEEPSEMDEEESIYERPEGRRPTYDTAPPAESPFGDNNRYSGVDSTTSYSDAPRLPRPSIDAYGAFSDPAPSGFAPPSTASENPRVSRTMQYADPYAAVRTAVTHGTTSPPPANPPSYSYGGGYQ